MLTYVVLTFSLRFFFFFFFNDTATTEIYTLSLHDALPILPPIRRLHHPVQRQKLRRNHLPHGDLLEVVSPALALRSEEHTSELQSRQYLVCRLLLEKKKKININKSSTSSII